MQKIEVSVSPKQLSKLRNGHRVRVKPAMSGCGIEMMVHPDRYNLMSNAMSSGRGVEICLSPEELMANRHAVECGEVVVS